MWRQMTVADRGFSKESAPSRPAAQEGNAAAQHPPPAADAGGKMGERRSRRHRVERMQHHCGGESPQRRVKVSR